VESVRRLEATQALLTEISRELEPPALLRLVTRRAAELVGGAAAGRCFLWDEASRTLVPRAWLGEACPAEQTPRRLGEGLAGAAAARREGLCVGAYRSSPYALPQLLDQTDITAALAVPLLDRERLVGVLTLDNRGSGRDFSERHLTLLRLFAGHAAVAIQNSRRFAAQERAAREARGLCDVSRSLASSRDPEQVLQLIAEKTTELLHTPHAQIVLWDEAAQDLRLGAAHGTEATQVRGQRFELGRGTNGIVAQTREPLVVNDYQRFPHRIPGMTQLAADVAVPILHRGRFLGVLDTHTTEAGRAFDADDVALLLNLATQAALAIENARLFQREQQRRKELEAVQVVVEEINHELNLSTVLRLIHEHALELARGDCGVIYLWDERGQQLTPKHWRGYGDWLAEHRARPGEGVVGAVAARRQGLIVNDFRTSPHATPLWLTRCRFVAVLAEPLLYRDRLVGVITVSREVSDQPFTVEDQRLLRLFASQAAIAIENARLFAELADSYQDLHAAQAELIRAEKLRALGQLTAGMAHDLNNTLAVILGQVELLQLNAPNFEMQEGLRTLATAVTDGAHVLRRLQGFAHQQPAGELARCQLGEVVEEAAILTRPRWREESQRQGRTITLRTEIAPDLPPILGCPSEIREALTNLVCNAVDAMPAGGLLTIAVREAPQAAAEWVELLVTDTGVGMPPEVLERAFDPFFTTKGARGTGLGLSLVYSTMERHGGRMEAASAPGQGTTVTLRFRRAPAEPQTEGPARTPSALPSRHILLVDDDPRVRTCLAGLLRTMGHRVTEAESGAMGLRLLAETPVDLLLTDFSMPGLTGLEVARAAKERSPGLPIVMLTGWGEQMEQEGGAPCGVDRLPGKPVRIQELVGVIGDLTGAPPA